MDDSIEGGIILKLFTLAFHLIPVSQTAKPIVFRRAGGVHFLQNTFSCLPPSCYSALTDLTV